MSLLAVMLLIVVVGILTSCDNDIAGNGKGSLTIVIGSDGSKNISPSYNDITAVKNKITGVNGSETFTVDDIEAQSVCSKVAWRQRI